jgi:5-methyltetrahydropteroyltriglutamate--homocysteine methyltransferase
MIRTTVVGSYPVPTWLKAHPSPEALRDAVRVVLEVQQRAGIDVISDGELTRWNAREFRPSGMVERFVGKMEGISLDANFAQRTAFRRANGVAYRGKPAGVVLGELKSGHLDLEGEWQIAAELTSAPLKFTLTSPYMIAKLIHDEWYQDFNALLSRIAAILAEQLAPLRAAVIQIDEPNLPGTPGDALIAAKAINRVLQNVSQESESAVHLCFGNFGGQRVQDGDYGHLLEFFDELECDHLVLETTRRPLEEVRLLRDVKPSIDFGFGVIDVKDLQVESPSLVAERIESLAAMVGEARIKYVHPDCGLSHLPRDVADQKLAALRGGCDLFLGRSARIEHTKQTAISS